MTTKQKYHQNIISVVFCAVTIRDIISQSVKGQYRVVYFFLIDDYNHIYNTILVSSELKSYQTKT